MKALIVDLTALVKKQIDTLRDLEQVMFRQNEALVSRDVNEIIETVMEQGRCLAAIGELDEERKRIVTRLAEHDSFRVDSTLTEIASRVDGDAGNELRTLGQSMKRTLRNVGDVNARNRDLIDQSRRVVQEILNELGKQRTGGLQYDQSGAATGQATTRKILDRTT